MKKSLLTTVALATSITAMAQTKPAEAKKIQSAIIPMETWQAIYSTFTGSYGQAKQDVLHSTQLTADQKVAQQIAIDAYVDKIMGAVIIDSLVVNVVKPVKKP